MKKLSIAFVWHLHQPNYGTHSDDVMLMPWTRLNAVQTYAGMLDYLSKYPNLKLNFDISPVLLDAIESYSKGEISDIHSNLTLTPVEELTQDDMEFVLNYFFDLDYNRYIAKYPRYVDLYRRRFANEELDTDDFSMSGYSDIMTLFNLVWFTDKQIAEYPEVAEVAAKGKHYAGKHREVLLEAQRDIISKIIPNFRKYISENRVEILTCPYYHPILPLLADMDSAKTFSLRNPLPGSDIKMPDCVRAQIESGLKRTEEIFGVKPTGMWAPEQCISNDVIKMMSDAGIKWTISDETVLSDTINKEIVRDFKGFHQDPFDLCRTYSVDFGKNQDFRIIFRDAVLPNLLSFEYPNYDAKTAAKDLYDRIKVVSNKIQNAPSENHLLTIAMDGENAWRNYADGGVEFLDELYKLISEDNSLETVKISEYMKKVDGIKKLESIKTGSGIKKDFRFWTAEPVKNMAWRYLFNVYEDLKNFEQYEDPEKIKEAYKELYTAQGSDWFWWFGEPNDSGQDHLFDYLFREHLKNIYTILGKPVPEHLEKPLTTFSGKPSRIPKGLISPTLRGKADYDEEWKNAGCIDIPASPLMQENKLFNKIFFGSDYDNLYLLFDVNRYIYSLQTGGEQIYQVYIYIKTNKDEFQYTAPVRPLNKTENVCTLIKNAYTHEIKLTFMKDKTFPLFFAKAIKNNLWVMDKNNSIEYIYDEIIEMKIPFDDLGVNPDEKIDFFIINGTFGRVEDVYPQDLWLTVKRPQRVDINEENLNF